MASRRITPTVMAIGCQKKMVTISSRDNAEARRNVLKSYKNWIKTMPSFIDAYELERRPYQIKAGFKK